MVRYFVMEYSQTKHSGVYVDTREKNEHDDAKNYILRQFETLFSANVIRITK